MPLHCRKSRVTGLMALLVLSGAGCEPEEEVCDLAPLALNEMPDLRMLIGEVEEISLPHYFGEPCRRELSYTASSSASSAVTVSIAGVTLTVTAVDEVDSAIVRVEAGNSKNQFAVHRFYVSVELPNRAPIAVGSIPDSTVQVGRWIEQGSVNDKFNDPDGDSLVYRSRSDTTIAKVVGVFPYGERTNVHGVGVGITTITITATDPEGLSDSIEFDVTVTPFTEGGSPPGEMHMSEKLFFEVPLDPRKEALPAQVDCFIWEGWEFCDAALPLGLHPGRVLVGPTLP